jgi:hypothetical protein
MPRPLANVKPPNTRRRISALARGTLDDLADYESRIHSQNGEDGVLARIFSAIGCTNRFFVEFGVGADGQQRNTRLLQAQGWRGLLMDAGAEVGHPDVRRERITAENINDLFAKYHVPHEFDLLSIDIDGNDYWVWEAIDERYRPRVLVMEYNASVPPNESKSIAYDPDFRWRGTDYFGASLLALSRLSNRKGYSLLYCESRGINAFFLRHDCVPCQTRPLEEIYRPPGYGKKSRLFWWRPRQYGHRPDPDRRLIDVA